MRGTTKVDSKVVTAQNNWRYKFENLDKYDDNNALITYTVTEEPVEHYETEVSGYNITNTYTTIKDTTTVSGLKIWNQTEHDENKLEITVELYRNGISTGKTETTNKSKEWKFKFEDLEKTDEHGENYVYTVVETKVTYEEQDITNEFTVTYEDNDETHYTTITNTKGETQTFDLSLRKFITKVGTEEVTNRIPQVNTANLVNKTDTTAEYNHTKVVRAVKVGQIVEYTIRVYNEGSQAGYADEIIDHIPEGLKYVQTDLNTEYGWRLDDDGKTVRTNYLSKEEEEQHNRANKLSAFDGQSLDYRDIKIECMVEANVVPNKKLTNIAEIGKYTDEDGEEVEDRDSQAENVNIPEGEDRENYKDDEINNPYVPGQQDDDDFEKVIVEEDEEVKVFDLSLRKFISKVGTTKVSNRIPQVVTDRLKSGAQTTAEYNHTKQPVKVKVGDLVVYTIRVYNEGDQAGYAEEIVDHVPDALELVESELNTQYGWRLDEDGKTIRTNYLSKQAEEQGARNNKLEAFDGESLDYRDIQVECRVSARALPNTKLTNIAEIAKSTDEEGNDVVDRDSQGENAHIPSGKELEDYKDEELYNPYIPGQQDDDDFDKVIVEEETVEVKEYDLALRKFITAIDGEEREDRIPQIDLTKLIMGEATTAEYKHPKTPIELATNQVVTYTIRIYNEGPESAYASIVEDDIPEGLEYLIDNEINKQYRWKLLDENRKEITDVSKAKYVTTDYLSKEQGEENLLRPFDGKLDYRAIKIAFKVIEPETSDRIVTNSAQIVKETDASGKLVRDRDSTPGQWINGEDDQDVEHVKVKYFDLSLRKWVTKAIVTVNGETKVTETGHKAEDDPEEVVKVDLKKANVDEAVVKFEYQIRIKNEGEIAGYAKEIKDYVPQGLKFNKADNPQWTEISENVITTNALEDTLLEPGETAEVTVVLTWVNSKSNMGIKVNTAEISKDYNKYETKDIDSTPDNKKAGEDDIDDAPVMLTVKTGLETVGYILVGLTALAIVGIGVAQIKRRVIE